MPPFSKVTKVYAKANDPNAAWTSDEKAQFSSVFNGKKPPNPRASVPVAPSIDDAAEDMQKANLADPTKAPALEKTRKAREKFFGAK